MPPSADAPPPRKIPKRVIALGVMLLLSVTACIIAYSKGWLRPTTLRAIAEDAGPWGMAGFVGAIIGFEMLWLPRAWGLLVAGVLFGPVFGALLTIAGDTGSALLCYALARRAGRDWAVRLVERRPRTRAVVDLLANRQGGLTTALLRCVPIAHYTAVSYAAGLAGVRPLPFIVGNTIGLVPAAVLYPMFGDAVLHPGTTQFYVMVAVIGVALFISIFIARRVFKMARDAAREAAAKESAKLAPAVDEQLPAEGQREG